VQREPKEVLAELVEKLQGKLEVKATLASPAEAGPRAELGPNLDRLTVGVDLGDQRSHFCILGWQGSVIGICRQLYHGFGRTLPVSGHYDDAQQETWTIFVAAYRAGAKALREGVTGDQVFQAWQKELVSHRASAKSALAQHAIDSWSDRKNVPFWEIHATNLIYDYVSGRFRAGTTINFEPIAEPRTRAREELPSRVLSRVAVEVSSCA